MTVIAWDGKTLAADRLSCSGATKGTVTKIFRCGGELLALAGSLSVGMEMLAWYRDGADVVKYPESNRNPDTGCSLILIRADGTAWKFESTPYPFRVLGLGAWGSGDESAKVAMHCGKTAAEAVEITSLYNTGCGNGVDTLTLE